MVTPYDPSQAAAPQSPFKLSSDPGFLQALSGFASGNNVGEQFASVNNILAGNAEKQQAEEVKNKTLSILEGQSPEIAAALKAGAMTPQQAMSAAMQQRQAAADASKPKWQLQNVNGRLVRVDVNSGKTDELGNYEKPVDLPASVQEFEYAKKHGYGGDIVTYQRDKATRGNDDFASRQAAAQQLGIDPKDPRYDTFILTGKMPREDQQQLTAVDKKAILEADEMVAVNAQAIDALKAAKQLSDTANSGFMAGTRATLGANLPDYAVPDALSSPDSSNATINYDNAVIGQALGQLKAIFGGAPTEGERKILLDLQGSSNMPAEARKQILDRAIAAAERRLQFNQERATDLRGGDYYKPGRTDAAPVDQPATNNGVTKSGLKFSVEP